jgi:sulfite exporter TauE/SafE
MGLPFIIAGFVLGSISSFHCVGMCGPLALALPVQHLPGFRKSLSLGLYHLGRISVYAGFGLIFGLAGRGLYVAGYQQWFSVGLGLFMIFMLVQYFIYKNFPQPAFIQKVYQKIQFRMMQLWKHPSRAGFLLLGMANGLLPCGMVYLAIAGALNTSGIDRGIFFMVFFGLGTLPPLFALSYFGSLFKRSFRNKIRQFTPYIVALMAIVLILRGLNLGIPYLSPLLGTVRTPAINCH